MLTVIDSNALLDRLRFVHARGRVADALLGVTLDVIEPFAVDYLSADEYVGLCNRVQTTVDATTEAALATIAVELARVAEADPDLMLRLQRANTSGRTG
jgi:hypothetical protein